MSARGLARDVLPLLGGWLGAGALFGLYRRPTLGRLAATWLVGVTAGVVVRAAVLQHTDAGKEAAFLVVALVFTLLLRARGASAYRLRRCRAHGLGRVGVLRREVLGEHLRELARLRVVALRVGPRRARVEQRSRRRPAP